MVVVYPIGFPAVLGWWLFRHRHALSSEVREQDPELRSCSIMWEPYKCDKYFYEVGKESNDLPYSSFKIIDVEKN